MKNETHEYMFRRLASAELLAQPQEVRDRAYKRFELHMYRGGKSADFFAWESPTTATTVEPDHTHYYENALLFYTRNLHITAEEAARRLFCICGTIPQEIIERIASWEDPHDRP